LSNIILVNVWWLSRGGGGCILYAYVFVQKVTGFGGVVNQKLQLCENHHKEIFAINTIPQYYCRMSPATPD